jgi:RNA polymerase sigma-70 factor (sigma-E family)
VGATERAVSSEDLGRDGVAELYERHVGRAVGLARLLTGDATSAEDIAHEAFLKVAGRFGHLRRPDRFDAYLRRTVVNLCRAGFRHASVERAWLRKQPAVEAATPPSYDPDDRDVIWEALGRLPYRQRAALVLRYYEDLSVEQTGEVLRCSTRAANSLLARALASLREVLKEEDVR